MFDQKHANELIPDHMHDALRSYLEMGLLPGSFLTAVLENDLKGAFGAADHINASRLKDYVSFLSNFAPSSCWGSPEKVAAWVAMFDEESQQACDVSDSGDKP